MSLTKLESSRNVTSKVISNRIKERNRQNPQNNMIASFPFAFTAHVTQWSNYLTQRAEVLTRRSNLTPQRAKNIVNDLRSVVSVLPKSLATKSKLASQFPLFLSRDQQAALGSLLLIKVILPHTSLLDLSDVLAPSFANQQNRSHNRAAKHIKISCLPRESSLNHSWPSWIFPQAISDIHRVLDL